MDVLNLYTHSALHDTTLPLPVQPLLLLLLAGVVSRRQWRTVAPWLQILHGDVEVLLGRGRAACLSLIDPGLCSSWREMKASELEMDGRPRTSKTSVPPLYVPWVWKGNLLVHFSTKTHEYE